MIAGGNPLRILMLTEAMVTGGAETFALRLADHLRRAGHDCDLVCLHPDMIDPRLTATRPSVPLISVRLPLFRWIKRLDRRLDRWSYAPLRTRLTRRWIERNLPTYDIVHSHLFGADWIAAALKDRHPALKLVSTLHGDYHSFDQRSASSAERSGHSNWPSRRDRVLALIDRFVTISQQQYRQFTNTYRLPEVRMEPIYNGVERRERPSNESIPPAPFTIAMAARGSIPEKGWAALIEAFGRLEGDVRLLLIGEGPHLRGLESKYANDSRIIFAGFQADTAGMIARAHVFALPSTYAAESLPTVITEALSVGRPVVATDVGEISAMLSTDDGPAGTVLDPAADEALAEQLRAALQRYHDDRALLKSHADRASKAFERFDMERCTARYIALYRSVLESPPSSADTSASH